MLDPKLLRSALDEVAQLLQRRGFALPKDELANLETKRKELQVQVQNLQQQLNTR